MVLRKQYLDRLIRLRDKKIIKVVTGVRRCGKSTLLKQFEQYLLENGVVEEQVILLKTFPFCAIISVSTDITLPSDTEWRGFYMSTSIEAHK